MKEPGREAGWMVCPRRLKTEVREGEGELLP